MHRGREFHGFTSGQIVYLFFQDIAFSLQEEENLPANLLGHWLFGNALAQPSLC